MCSIKTKSGKEIHADNFLITSSQSSIFIRTDKLTLLEATTIFGDASESDVITVVLDDDPETESVYKHYTDLCGVQKIPSYNQPNLIQIWLRYLEPEE